MNGFCSGLIFFASVIIFPFAATARQHDFRDVKDAIADAVDEAREASRECRKAVLDDLRDVQDTVKSLQRDFEHKKVRSAIRTLEDLERNARRDCPGKIDRKIQRAIEGLEDTLKGRDEHRDRGDRDDSGAHGPTPMSATDFQALLTAVQRESFSKEKVGTVQTAASSAYFTVTQVGQLIDLMTFSADKIGTLQAVQSRIVDRQNVFQIYSHFTFSADKEQAKRILGQ